MHMPLKTEGAARAVGAGALWPGGTEAQPQVWNVWLEDAGAGGAAWGIRAHRGVSLWTEARAEEAV